MKSVLTIAGSDTSGGAGIQADLKTMCALGVFGQSAIAALTAQNTMGVQDVFVPDADFLAEQINSVFDDIKPDAVKIGMLPTVETVDTVAQKLTQWNAQHVVLDPVMVATSGAALSSNAAVQEMVAKLFPLAEVVTPNIPEAEALMDLLAFGSSEISQANIPRSITTEADMVRAAEFIQTFGCKNVLIKGGHSIHDANDFFLNVEGKGFWLRAQRVDTSNTHGTGCTLSSAIASKLALGESPLDAVVGAKAYLTAALSHDENLGKGNGPLNHMWLLGLSKEEIQGATYSLVSVCSA